MKIFSMMKRKNVVSQNKRNEVAYVRHGTDYVETLGSSSASGKKIATVWVATKDGRRYEIPVDPKTGRVPEEYLFSRFLSVHQGSRNGKERNILIDIGKDA